MKTGMSYTVVPGSVEGSILSSPEPLSFWGGVDPASGQIIDVHHPMKGTSLAGRLFMLPASRGSCSGSGVLLQLAFSGNGPAAIFLREEEEILTLGALVAKYVFDRLIPVAVLAPADFDSLSLKADARLAPDHIQAGDLQIPLAPLDIASVELSEADQSCLRGERGEAPRLAMKVMQSMACLQGANQLTDVTRGHIDGCILAHDANLLFAERMVELGAEAHIPTTINAISVDRDNWQSQSIAPDFGLKASRLSDAYVRMGCAPTFTCAPYTLESPPHQDEAIGWSESNAVIFANSVLGARTAKHPDFFDLFISVTGRAPLAGVYKSENRRPEIIFSIEASEGADDSFWPLLGWTIGHRSGGLIPLIKGLEGVSPTISDLKSLCAAFGTTSSAPMLHIAGHTPEADLPARENSDRVTITTHELAESWGRLNTGSNQVNLVALGSPHFSYDEAQAFAKALGQRRCHPDVITLMTVGRHTARQMAENGLTEMLDRMGVCVLQDLCWCSITEPVFPPNTSVIMTNSAKYAHYAPGLSGRKTRFGSLSGCADAAVSGLAPACPNWLSQF